MRRPARAPEKPPRLRLPWSGGAVRQGRAQLHAQEPPALALTIPPSLPVQAAEVIPG
jgi:hypothetical protein